MGGISSLVACVFALGVFGAGFASADQQGNELTRLRLAQAETSADVDELKRAQALLASGDAVEAYELLSAREVDWAGIPLFDYLLGMAALDTGRPGEAVFSLQRAVANEPGFAGARMELARAQYEAGEIEAARTQFDYLLTQSPPERTRAVIKRYIAAIEGRGSSSGGLQPYFELGAGYDSNANGSTSQQNFLGFTLDPNNVEAESGFAELALGLSHVAPVDGSTAWVNGLRLSHRYNADARFVDQSIAAIGTTVSRASGRTRVSAGINGYYSLLDGEDHEYGGALDLGIGGRFAENWDLGFNLRGGPVRYQDELLEVLATDRYLAALTLSRLNIGGRAARIGLTLVGGVDEERDNESPYGNTREGARLNGGWSLSPSASLYVEAGFLRTDYDDTPGFFGADREDEEVGGLIAFEFHSWPAEDWTLNPRVRYLQHDSNIALYEYDRWEASLYLRRSFR
jgi:tetratricopeptide (TPR) repeat protein